MTEKQKSLWRPIRPVPEDAPPPPAAHLVRGRPVALHEYRDELGALIGYVADFVRSDEITLKQMALCFCEDLGDGRETGRHRQAWRWRWFDPLRPVFGLERVLDARADGAQKPVLVLPTEAEANAASLYLHHEYACVSWAGGLKKIGETDWSTLKYRVVTIWLPAVAERYKAGVGDAIGGELKPLIHQSTFAPLANLVEILGRLECKVRAVLVKPGTEPVGWCAAQAFAPDRIVPGQTVRDVVTWLDRHAVPVSSAETLRLLAPFYDGTALAETQVSVTDESSEPVPTGTPAGVRDVPGQATRPGEGLAEGASPPSTAGAGESIEQRTAWMRGLLRDGETGRLLPELHNLQLVLRHQPEWRDVIYQDDFAHRIMKRKPPPFEGGRVGEWSDADDVMARGWMASRMNILRVKRGDVTDAVLGVASVNRVNPVQDYLNGLKWDGKPRLADWLITYCGAGERILPDHTAADIERLQDSNLMRYLRLVGPMFLMGAVKRALEPGCKFDYVMILEGEQGLGKSSVAAILGGPWGMDSPISFTHKDSLEALSGIWFVEIPELDAFSKADSTTSKSFFTRAKDRYRLPYAKRSADFLRACVFLGTTNEGEFYRDSTGNRRYWAVYCRAVDREGLQRDRDQLFAEAIAWLKRGERTWPNREEERDYIEPEQRKRMVFDPWVMMLGEWLTGKAGAVTMRDILIDALKLEPGKIDDNRMATRVGRAMKKLGWRKVENKQHPERFYYEKVDESIE